MNIIVIINDFVNQMCDRKIIVKEISIDICYQIGILRVDFFCKKAPINPYFRDNSIDRKNAYEDFEPLHDAFARN